MRLLILPYLLFALPLFAQEQVARWEIEKKMADKDFTVVSAKEDGLVIFRETDKYEDGDRKWELKFFDDSLQITQELEIFIDNDFYLLGYENLDGYFYLLFKEGIMNDNDWYLYQFDLVTGEHVKFKIPNEIEIELSHFIITDKFLVLGGRVLNKPTIVHFSFLNQRVDVLPGFYKKETELVDMTRNKNATFNVLFLDQEQGTGNNILWLKVFSPSGDLLLESSCTFEEDVRVHSGTTNKLEGEDLIITGTFGNKKSKLSQGLYFINVKPGGENSPVFTEFTKLDSFFKYMGEDREEKIKEKINESRNGKPYEYRATAIVWDVKEQKDHYAVFADVIDPEYQTNARRRFSPYGSTIAPFYDDYNTYSNTDRYYSNVHSLVNKDVMVSVDYEESFMVILDKNGRRVFDASHIIENVETPVLDQISAYNYSGSRFEMLYKRKNELYYTKGDITKKSQTDSLVLIKSLDPLDQVRNEEEGAGKVEYWYDKYYYSWGYQRIENQGNNERRTVFYINKVSL